MHPRQSKSQFLGHFLLGRGDLEVGVVYLVVLDRLLKAATKKGRQLFKGKNAPQTKTWLRLWTAIITRKCGNCDALPLEVFLDFFTRPVIPLIRPSCQLSAKSDKPWLRKISHHDSTVLNTQLCHAARPETFDRKTAATTSACKASYDYLYAINQWHRTRQQIWLLPWNITTLLAQENAQKYPNFEFWRCLPFRISLYSGFQLLHGLCRFMLHWPTKFWRNRAIRVPVTTIWRLNIWGPSSASTVLDWTGSEFSLLQLCMGLLVHPHTK